VVRGRTRVEKKKKEVKALTINSKPEKRKNKKREGG